ncbi:hypothetical protein A3Q56_06221, partial [Intoshia linei]
MLNDHNKTKENFCTDAVHFKYESNDTYVTECELKDSMTKEDCIIWNILHEVSSHALIVGITHQNKVISTLVNDIMIL